MAADDPLYLGSWERDRVLGTGGFGIVTLWKNNNTHERVAIKKCRWGVDSLMTATHKERWAREVVIMQRLSHPNVVQAVSVPTELEGLPSELPLLCMEFCSGGDLRQILNKPENCCGLREAEVRCLLSDTKAAVQYLHSQRITHRDLKPENIVLQEKPNCPMVYKLIDLGYAKELEATSVCSSFVGTMQYLAPEFFTSDGYSSSVDYWSLGLVSHEAITGVRPFLPHSASPADWMPKVEKKSTNDICVYEVPGSNKEIKYSQQLFVENFVSRCLREELEKWLRLALEWNPKKRGRSQPDNRLAIFSLLDEILSKKVVTVFCVTVMACHSYQVDNATAVSTLQLWIERDTRQPMKEQLLLLPSGKPLTHSHMAIDCWNPNEMTMLYVFSQTSFSLPYVKVADRMPVLVRWLMEHPKEALEYHHQKHIWRHAVFFLRQEYELFQLFLEAYAVKMLSLLEQSYELAQLESAAATELTHLIAVQKMSTETLEFDNKCYALQLASIPSLVGLGRLMSGWATEVNSCLVRVNSYREAVAAMTGRVQEAQTRTGMLQQYRDPGQEDLMSLENWMKEGYKCYDNIRKRKDRSTRHQSLDMARIVYNCLKQIDITLRNESFAVHLKQVMSCEAELSSLQKALASLKQQIQKTKQEVMRCQYLRQKETWALVKRLAIQREQESRSQSNMSLNIPSPNPQPSSPAISPLALSQPAPSFTVPPPPRNPSPVPQRETQVPVYPSPSVSPNANNGTDVNPTPSQTSPAPATAPLVTPGFDLSSGQTPMVQTHTPGGLRSLTTSFLFQPKSHLDSESLIMDNINIRYAMQDSIVSFTQCSDAISKSDFDWSYLDGIKK